LEVVAGVQNCKATGEIWGFERMIDIAREFWRCRRKWRRKWRTQGQRYELGSGENDRRRERGLEVSLGVVAEVHTSRPPVGVRV
jgi:hypothetical protein